ncbi:MAG: agmatine deiminase [Bacilli bacterium]|nr:agmatine deiminase [Bacilli bacterium]
MSKLDQTKTPFIDSLKYAVENTISPLDVPGHHMGNVDNVLKDYLGEMVFKADVNAPYGMDNLSHATGVLAESQALMADFCNADDSFFLINGTTAGILAMIMAVCRANERIILPRNVHKSIVNGLILSGAYPVYIMPKLDTELEIANQPTVDEYIKAMQKYPSAKAIFVINPTYFGAVTDLKRLVDEAHSRGMAVLVDEAHGAHYYFDKHGPMSAMDAGADISSVSFHKTGGSLTQSSVLLLKSKIISKVDVQKALNIINTTSPSTLLMASLEAARHHLALHGQQEMDEVHALSKYIREEISKINGFIPCGRKHFLNKGVYDYDDTKLVIELDHMDISGFDLYKLLKKRFDIQMELSETYVVLGILAIGTKKVHLSKLVDALKVISKEHYNKDVTYPRHAFSVDFPFQLNRPRSAYHAPGKKILLEDAENQISKESIMIYPPGIPLIIPGEVFSRELIERIQAYKKSNVTILSDYGADYVSVIDTDAWKFYRYYKNKLNDYIEHKISNPRSDGYYMPFEGDKHSGTIVMIPYRKDTWRKDAVPAIKEYKNVILAIAKYEPVYVAIAPRIYEKVINQFTGLKNVIPVKVKYNDAWARDTAPIFVTNGNDLRTVDFRFNAYGGDFDGLYSNYKDDDQFTKNMSKYFKLDRYNIEDFILEGGSIHVDGEKTCIVTEACLLSEGRNPMYSKLEIEEVLKTNLNVTKVIWLKNGIYNDETNEHIDNMCCFVRPGVVALAWTDNKDDIQYKYSSEAYKVLKNSTDAEGRKLQIIKVKVPNPIYTDKDGTKGIVKGKCNAKPREVGDRLAASYINYYQGEKFVILPKFGVPEDQLAYKQFKAMYPEKDIIQIDSKEILLGGGNIHCITMQIPYMKGLNDYED